MLATVLWSCAGEQTPPAPPPVATAADPSAPPADTPERPKTQPVEPCLVYPTRYAALNGRPRNTATAQTELEKGVELAHAGNHFAAIEAFDRALAADPYHGLTHLAKAESHLFTDNDSALMRKHLATAVLLLPENPRAHSRLADFLAEIGETEAALIHWRCALALKSTFAEARINLARYLVEMKRGEEAESELRAIEGGTSDVTVLVLLADALVAQGKLLDAAQQIEEAARRAGPSAALLRRAGDLYEAGNSPLSARRVRAQADRIDPPPAKRQMRPLKQRQPKKK